MDCGLSTSILRSRGFQLTTRGASPSGTSAVWRGPSSNIVSPRSSHHNGRCSMTSTKRGLPENDSITRSPAMIGSVATVRAGSGTSRNAGRPANGSKIAAKGDSKKKPPSFRSFIEDGGCRQQSRRQHPSPRELEPGKGFEIAPQWCGRYAGEHDRHHRQSTAVRFPRAADSQGHQETDGRPTHRDVDLRKMRAGHADQVTQRMMFATGQCRSKGEVRS